METYLELLQNGNPEEDGYLKKTAECLVACIDSIEKTDMQLYEHYRALVDEFRQGIRTLSRQSWWQAGDYGQLDAETGKMLADAIIRACAMNVILQEKYQSIGERLQAVSGEDKN